MDSSIMINLIKVFAF